MGPEGRPIRWLVVSATVAVTCTYAVWLLPASGVGLIAGLPEAVVALSLGAVLALAIPTRIGFGTAGVVSAGIALIVVPAAASISIVANGFGPFDTPFEPKLVSLFIRNLTGAAQQTAPLLPLLKRPTRASRFSRRPQTSALAAPIIYDSGREVLPIGGFSGTIPEPSLTTLKSMIAKGDFHLVVQSASPPATDPRLVWVARHCLTIISGTGPPDAPNGLHLATYYCSRPAKTSPSRNR